MAMLPSPALLSESASVPMATLRRPSMLLPSAPAPLAVFKLPLMFFWSADSPVAVFRVPVVLLKSALNPVAVLREPDLLSCIALKPMAVFLSPLLLLVNASTPNRVFWSCACNIGESAKQTSAIVTRTGGMLVFISGESRKNLVRCRGQFAAAPSHRFQFQKSRQLFIRADNETLSVAVMRVNNEVRSLVGIHPLRHQPTPSGSAEIISD